VRVVVDELVARVGTDGHYGVANGVLGFPSSVGGPSRAGGVGWPEPGSPGSSTNRTTRPRAWYGPARRGHDHPAVHAEPGHAVLSEGHPGWAPD
jgi:hypothetical protein